MDFYIVAIFAEKLYLAKQTTKHLTYHWRNVDPRFHNLHHVGSFTFSFQSKFTNGSFISYYVPVLFYWNHSSFPAVLTPSHIYTEPASLQSCFAREANHCRLDSSCVMSTPFPLTSPLCTCCQFSFNFQVYDWWQVHSRAPHRALPAPGDINTFQSLLQIFTLTYQYSLLII